MNLKHLVVFFFVACSFGLYAQEITVTGKVTSATDGTTLPGVNVIVKGTTYGTTTGIDGSYTTKVPSNGTLLFSFIGFKPQEIAVGGKNIINIVLSEESVGLEEVVVVGYGTQRKKDLTTAVALVSDKEIKDRPIVSAAQALQGKAAGVQVTSPSGKPGQGLSVRVRGATSVLAGNEPLYVVDGLPTTDIQGLNASDIASMSVLKDASSAAIYGARAANGVVLITTKRGNNKAPLVTYNSYFGASKLRKTIDVLSTKKYRELIDEIMPGSLDPSATGYTNWSDETFGTGHTQSYQFSVAGGSEKLTYFLSAGYLSDQGIVDPAQFDRYSVRLNLDNEVKSWLKVGVNFNVLNINTKDTPDNASSGRGGVIMSALNTPPFLKVYKSDGSGWFDPNPFQPSWENPIAYMRGSDQLSVDNHIVGSLNLDAKLIEGLVYKTRVGADILSHQWDYYVDPFRTNYGRQQNGIGSSDKFNSNTMLWENTLDYTITKGEHSLTALVGSSIQKYKGNDSYLTGNDFPADVSVKTINAANVISGSTNVEEWALASFFGRATYAYNSKYYATFSVRRDGSSKLAQHWGTMPSFSLGWRLSSEEFMKDLTFINDLKLRGGWGMNGNQEGIPNYARYGLVNYYRRTPTNPLSGPSSSQVTYGNPDLKWETTAQSNIGFDLSMLKSRIVVNVDAYYKKTSDVLLNVQLSNSLPITSIQTNAGEIENKGFEFNISTVNNDSKWKWTTDFNMSFNRNKVTDLNYTDVYYFGRVYSNNSDVAIVKVGLPLGSFFGYVSDGVDPATGNIKYRDLNKNGIFDTGDRTIIGNAQPKFTYGITNTFSYQRFDLNIFFQGSYGNDIYNATRIDLEGMFDSKNQSTSVLRRWTTPGQITDMPRSGNMDNVRNSTRFVEDGSYLRLKSLTLSYRVIDNNPKIKAIRKLAVYVTGQNLLTFTKYSGFDPEVNAFGGSAVELGIDYGTYPQAQSLIVGLNVEF